MGRLTLLFVKPSMLPWVSAKFCLSGVLIFFTVRGV